MARLSAVAVIAVGLCTPSVARAQAAAANAETKPEPTKVGSMAPVGTKPSKAEREKMEASGGQPSTMTPTPAASGAQAGAAGQLSDTDRQFMLMAAKDGMKEVHMGQMAAQQGQSDTIKKLGQMIAADHTKANQQLMAIATKKGVKRHET